MFVVVGALSALVPVCVSAQTPPVPPRAGDVTITGSLRTRVESWNWFGDSPAGEYTYPAALLRVRVAQSRKTVDWQAELALPVLIGLPDDAVAPGAQGALGLGANYFAANANDANVAGLFAKQINLRFKRIGGVDGQALRIGRFEFVDGTETAPGDATVAALKRDRIAHRLIGTFAFSHVGRSLDGAHYVLDRGDWNVTALAVRPTRGVFDVDGWADLDVNLFYGAITRRAGSAPRAGEWRAFGIGYSDYRHDVLKVDNRPLTTRRTDTERIDVATVGGHYLQTWRIATGTVDLLLWGAVQAGTWGTLRHRAGAYAIEGGWQPGVALAPWFRGGWNYGSGDGNASDRSHRTFLQLLPTPRVYARLPFFNMMNTSDAFGEITLNPSRKVMLRGSAHALHLASANDLWYQGGGAFQPSTFGYAGRPSNGRTSLSTLADASTDVVVSSRLTFSAYLGYAAGRPVTDSIYGSGGTRLGYLEMLLRF
jgi:hypothetical protein